MSEGNDLFDDLIDDEFEMEDFDPDGDSEEADDDEPAEVRTAVMSKNGMIALLSLKNSAAGSQVVRFDPRQPMPTAQSYEDSATAAMWFGRSLATSKRNGWSVVYDGEPLFG